MDELHLVTAWHLRDDAAGVAYMMRVHDSRGAGVSAMFLGDHVGLVWG